MNRREQGSIFNIENSRDGVAGSQTSHQLRDGSPMKGKGENRLSGRNGRIANWLIYLLRVNHEMNNNTTRGNRSLFLVPQDVLFSFYHSVFKCLRNIVCLMWILNNATLVATLNLIIHKKRSY